MEDVGPGQLLNISQAKQLQELTGGPIQVGPTQFVAAPDYVHQALIHQLPKYLSAGYSANGFDVRSQGRLTVGHDCQGLHGGRRQTDLGGNMFQSAKPRGELRPREQLHSAGQFLNAERSPGAIIHSVKSANQCTCLGSVRQVGVLTKFSAIQRLFRQE